MLELSEIHAIISEFHVRINLVPHASRRRDSISHLYDILRSKNRGEDEINRLREKAGKQNFALVKTRLKKKLLNSLYFIEPIKGKNSEQTIAFIQVQKHLYRCYLLQRFGGDRNLHTEAHRGLKLALKFQLTKEALEFGIILRSYFCRNGAFNKFRYYSTVVDEQLEKYNAELKATVYYQEFIIHYYKRLSYKKETISALKRNITAVTDLRVRFQSLTIGIIYYRLSIYENDIEARYRSVYDLSQEAIAYLRKTGNVATKSDFAEFYLYQLASCIYIRDLEKGSVAYEECISLYPEATINWFTCQELYLLLLFHTHQFTTAANIVSGVLHHRAFRILPEFITEKWLVYDLYLQYANGTLSTPKRKTSSKKVLHSMLRRTHELKGDKSGFAFSVRLMYILSLLETGAFGELTEQIDAFRIYCSRYLPPKEYPKTRAFLKLIFLVEKHSYNYLIIKTKAQKYLAHLNASEVAHREANENIQILPYDLIWERVMNAIHRNSSKLAKERVIRGI